jgi:pilus assembly protein CpaB
MNTARIVVLTIVLGAVGIAGCRASGSENKQAAAEPVAQLKTIDVLVARSDIDLGQLIKPEHLRQTWPAVTASSTSNMSDDQAPKRGESVSVVRYGIAIEATAQK